MQYIVRAGIPFRLPSPGMLASGPAGTLISYSPGVIMTGKDIDRYTLEELVYFAREKELITNVRRVEKGIEIQASSLLIVLEDEKAKEHLRKVLKTWIANTTSAPTEDNPITIKQPRAGRSERRGLRLEGLDHYTFGELLDIARRYDLVENLRRTEQGLEAEFGGTSFTFDMDASRDFLKVIVGAWLKGRTL